MNKESKLLIGLVGVFVLCTLLAVIAANKPAKTIEPKSQWSEMHYVEEK